MKSITKQGTALVVLAFLITMLAGCDDQPRIAMAYIMDPTSSCDGGRVQFSRNFEKLIAGGYLGKGQICIVHACSHPHLLPSAPALRRASAAGSRGPRRPGLSASPVSLHSRPPPTVLWDRSCGRALHRQGMAWRIPVQWLASSMRCVERSDQ